MPRKKNIETLQSGVNHLENSLLHEAQREALLPRNIPKTVNELMLDPIVAGSITFLKSLLLRDWYIVPHEDSTDFEKRIVGQLNDSLNDLQPFSKRQFFESALSAIEYGQAISEVSIERAGGIYTFNEMTPINVQNIKKFRFRKGRLVNLEVMKPQNDADYLVSLDGDSVVLDAKKVLHFKLNPSLSKPLGTSLLENVYVPAMMRKTINEYSLVNTARQAGGIVSAYIPAEYLQSWLAGEVNSPEAMMVDYIKQGLANLHAARDAFLILPSNVYPDTSIRQFEVKPMSEAQSTSYSANQDLERLAKDIQFALQTNIAALGSQSGSSGSFALASEKTSLLVHFVRNIQAMFSDEFQRKALKLVWEMNGVDPKHMPHVEFEDIEDLNLDDFSKSVQRVAMVGGITPDENLEAFIRETFGLPAADYTKRLYNEVKADPVERLETNKEL